MNEQILNSIAEMFIGCENITPIEIAKRLIASGLLSETRSAQYAAVKEFYQRYGKEKKIVLLQELSQKYNISLRTLINLTTSERRFKFT